VSVYGNVTAFGSSAYPLLTDTSGRLVVKGMGTNGNVIIEGSGTNGRVTVDGKGTDGSVVVGGSAGQAFTQRNANNSISDNSTDDTCTIAVHSFSRERYLSGGQHTLSGSQLNAETFRGTNYGVQVHYVTPGSWHLPHFDEVKQDDFVSISGPTDHLETLCKEALQAQQDAQAAKPCVELTSPSSSSSH